MSEPRYLRAARQAAGLSLAGVAEAIGLTESAVSYIETGRRIPRISTLHAYAKAVGLTDLARELEPLVAELEHGGVHANANSRREPAVT